MKPDTWMPLYVTDYLGDTMHLTTEQHGAYLLLLMACWKRGGSLPNDDAHLAGVARMTVSAWRKSAPTLRAFFRAEGELLVHKRVSEEAQKAQRLSDARRETGRLGGRPKKQTESEQKPIGLANGKQTETPARVARPSPSTSPNGDIPPNPPSGGGGLDLFEETFAAYPETGRKQTPPDCAREAWDDTLAQQFQPQAIRQAVAALCASPPDRVPRFDRWLTKGLWLHYAPKATDKSAGAKWNGPPDLRAALVRSATQGEAWVRGYIDAWTRYQDLPSKALLCANAFAMERVGREVGHVLRDWGVELRLQEAAA